MGITLVIVGGVVLMTVFATFFEYLGKKKSKPDRELETRVQAMEKRFLELEERLSDKDSRISRLETELSFVNKLIEDRSK